MEQNDLETMQNPDLWPKWFILPLKKISKLSSSNMIGILSLKGYLLHKGDTAKEDHWEPAQKPTVLLINMYDFAEYKDPADPKKILFDKIPQKTYDSWQELLADGWVVD